MDASKVIDVKNIVDEHKICDILDLYSFIYNNEKDNDLYYLVNDSDFIILFDAYIKLKNSIYNQNLIKRYYENLQNGLIV